MSSSDHNHISFQFLLEKISSLCSSSLKQPVQLTPIHNTHIDSSGSGCITSILVDSYSQTHFFLKLHSKILRKCTEDNSSLLESEYNGLQALYKTQTIRTPRPIVYGSHDFPDQRFYFLISEYLKFCSQRNEQELGYQLAKLHKKTEESERFGFYHDNNIGVTPQCNSWETNWCEFWLKHRLTPMIENAEVFEFFQDKNEIKLLTNKIKSQLENHHPQSSLVHGDLWSGNVGYIKSSNLTIKPVIFDPAIYYGDREVDIAMTELFSNYGEDFYKAYEQEWKLDQGYEKRKVIYNFYHILNHLVLFGRSSYGNQVREMIKKILKF